MSRSMIAGAALAGALVCGAAHAHQAYLYIWTSGVGDASDKLLTVDARRGSDRYGKIVHTLWVGGRGELRSFGLSADGRTLRAVRAAEDKLFELDVGTDPARPRLRRVADRASAAEDAPTEARDGKRVFLAGAASRPAPDAEHFVRAFNGDSDALVLTFEIDFRAPRLGLPRALVLQIRDN
jgi:hypothetical protein